MVLRNRRKEDHWWRIVFKIGGVLRARWKFVTFLIIVLLTLTGLRVFVANARPIQEPGQTEFLFVPLPRSLVNSGGNSKNLPVVPIIVSNPIGGIGNQMFQYACAYSVARSLHASQLWIQVPKAFAELNASGVLNTTAADRHFALANFNIGFHKVNTSSGSKLMRNWDENQASSEPDEREILDYVYGIREIEDGSKDPVNFLNIRVYCESETYFKPYKEELIQSFQMSSSTLDSLQTPEVRKLLEEIQSVESVCLHLRRGDFTTVGGGLYRVLPPSYYQRAMALIEEKVANPRFYIFSDDVDYARSLFGEDRGNVTYVSGSVTTVSLQDFLLMQKCRHMILANSSFSWWAAYLNRNRNKTVIAPFPKYKSWYVYAKYNVFEKYYRIPEFYPAEWLKLNPWE